MAKDSGFGGSGSGGGGDPGATGSLDAKRLAATESLARSGALVDLEKLTLEQRAMTDRAVQISREPGIPGVVVGVVQGGGGWDFRPLLLDAASARVSGQGAALQLVRMSDPHAYLDTAKKAFFDQQLLAFAQARKVSANSMRGVLSCGASQGHFWIRRKFFDRTLADVIGAEALGSEGANAKSFPAVIFAQRLIASLAALHRSGVVHGHVCPSNVALEGDEPVLIDFGFRVLTAERPVASEYFAPELNAGAVPTEAADVFGLGQVLLRLLRNQLSAEHRAFLESMHLADPLQRPTMKSIEERFVPNDRPRTVSSPSGKALGGAPIRSGKLLGTGGAAPISFGAQSGTTADQRAVTHSNPASQTSAGQDAPSVAAVDSPPSGSPSAAATPRPIGFVITPGLKRLIAGAFAALILVGVGTQLWTPFSERVQMYQEQWSSADAKVRQQVVFAAVNKNDDAAQSVIIDDMLAGAARPGVRVGLLRVAFNSLWKDDLSAEDRLQALTLALSPLVQEVPPELEPLRDAHPGVQLAALGDLGLRVEEAQLMEIKLSSLAALPAPYGTPFVEFSKLGIDSMKDVSARALAHIVVGNFGENAVQVFLGPDSSAEAFLARALVLAPFVELYPPVAAELQRIMLARDDVFTKRIEWFRNDPSKQWGDATPSTQVLLALGLEPQAALSVEQRSDLLMFPAARIRATAIEKLSSVFTVVRVGRTLSYLGSEDHRLTRPQVVLLLSAFLLQQREPQNPSVGSFLSRWFETSPDAQSVLGLLAARREVEGADPFSLEAARYLSARSWEATLPQLRDLVFHREKLARALAYSRLDAALPDEAKLLEEAVRNENDARLRSQLISKLQSASILQKLPEGGAEAQDPAMVLPESPLPEQSPQLPEEEDDSAEVLDSPL